MIENLRGEQLPIFKPFLEPILMGAMSNGRQNSRIEGQEDNLFGPSSTSGSYQFTLDDAAILARRLVPETPVFLGFDIAGLDSLMHPCDPKVEDIWIRQNRGIPIWSTSLTMQPSEMFPGDPVPRTIFLGVLAVATADLVQGEYFLGQSKVEESVFIKFIEVLKECCEKSCRELPQELLSMKRIRRENLENFVKNHWFKTLSQCTGQLVGYGSGGGCQYTAIREEPNQSCTRPIYDYEVAILKRFDQSRNRERDIFLGREWIGGSRIVRENGAEIYRSELFGQSLTTSEFAKALKLLLDLSLEEFERRHNQD